MQDLEVYKFECIFEQLKLFASFNSDAQVIRNQNETKKFTKFEYKFIHMLSVGMLQLEVCFVCFALSCLTCNLA